MRVPGKVVATYGVNPGGQIGRAGHEAAEPDQHVGPLPAQHVGGGVDGSLQPAGHAQQVAARAARDRHRRDQRELVAAGRDDPGVQPALGAQRGDLGVGKPPAQRVGEREGRLDVAGGPASGNDDVHGTYLAVRGRLRRGRANDSSMPSPSMVGTRAEPP
jgi:hypothetical protein